jgi:hypothetical protein
MSSMVLAFVTPLLKNEFYCQLYILKLQLSNDHENIMQTMPLTIKLFITTHTYWNIRTQSHPCLPKTHVLTHIILLQFPNIHLEVVLNLWTFNKLECFIFETNKKRLYTNKCVICQIGKQIHSFLWFWNNKYK